MKSPLGKIGLFVAAVILSCFPASYVGQWYNQITPQYGNFITDSSDAMIFSGWLMSFGFFAILVYGLFGFKENKNWLMVLLIPSALLWLSSDPYHIYIPVAFGLAGFVLVKLINLVIGKIHHSNPTMMVK